MIKLLYELSAFTYQGQNGNKAGVVLDANECSKEYFQYLAKKFNYSEIAFVKQSSSADYEIRFFTPNSEIDMCGHATIACFGLLKQLGKLSKKKYSVKLNIGIIDVYVKENSILMKQLSPVFEKLISRDEICESLNISDDMLGSLPVQKVSTGIYDIIIPIKSKEILNSIRPNYDKITSISKSHVVVGYHLFSIDDKKIYTRNFAPLYGINEECATGSSSGALACYLFKNSLIKTDILYSFYQGESMNMLSKIDVYLERKNNSISVYVGGEYSKFTCISL